MTKIEVLVVLLVIGVLGTISVFAVSTARQQTRDIARLSHVREVQDSLESFFTDHSAYPIASEPIALGQGTTRCLSADGFDCSIPPDESYLEIVPTPPSSGLQGEVQCDDVKNVYCYKANSEQYRVEFELERDNGVLGLARGVNCATEMKIASGACPALN